MSCFLLLWAKCAILCDGKLDSGYYKNGPGFVPSLKPTQSHLNNAYWSTEYPTGVGTYPASSHHGPNVITCVMENQIQAYYKMDQALCQIWNQLKAT